MGVQALQDISLNGHERRLGSSSNTTVDSLQLKEVAQSEAWDLSRHNQQSYRLHATEYADALCRLLPCALTIHASPWYCMSRLFSLAYGQSLQICHLWLSRHPTDLAAVLQSAGASC